MVVEFRKEESQCFMHYHTQLTLNIKTYAGINYQWCLKRKGVEGDSAGILSTVGASEDAKFQR